MLLAFLLGGLSGRGRGLTGGPPPLQQEGAGLGSHPPGGEAGPQSSRKGRCPGQAFWPALVTITPMAGSILHTLTPSTLKIAWPAVINDHSIGEKTEARGRRRLSPRS